MGIKLGPIPNPVPEKLVVLQHCPVTGFQFPPTRAKGTTTVDLIIAKFVKYEVKDNERLQIRRYLYRWDKAYKYTESMYSNE